MHYGRRTTAFSLSNFHIERLLRVVTENVDYVYDNAAQACLFVRVQGGDQRELPVPARAVRRPSVGESMVLKVPVDGPVVDQV
jgi:hypothetical protein